MPKISLKIHFPNSHEGYKMMQFEDTTLVKKAIEEINSKRNERKANLDTIKGKRTPLSPLPGTSLVSSSLMSFPLQCRTMVSFLSKTKRAPKWANG